MKQADRLNPVKRNRVGLCHYQIAAYAILRHITLPKYKKTGALQPVLLFFSAHIGDAVLFMDALETYKNLYSQSNGYHLVIACRKEVRSFLEAMGYGKGVEFIDVNRDKILRSYGAFKKAVREVNKYRYALFLNPRVVSIIEYVFEYCVCADKRHIVEVEGSQSKSSRKERLFRKTQDNDIFYVPKDMMMLGRFRQFANYLSGEQTSVVIPRMKTPECDLELPKRYFVCAPSTAETPSKCWDQAKYARLIDELIEAFDLDVCLSGSKNDVPVCEKIESQLTHRERVRHYVGNTNLQQWVKLIAESEFVVSNDSSPAHIAAATATPCVCICGQWEGKSYYPYVVEERREDDCLPVEVLGEQQPCYYCTLSQSGRMGNPECRKTIEQSMPYPCIACVEYQDVVKAVYDIYPKLLVSQKEVSL